MKIERSEMRQTNEDITISLLVFCTVAIGYFVVVTALNMGVI